MLVDLPVETAVQLMTNEAELKKISTQAQGRHAGFGSAAHKANFVNGPAMPGQHVPAPQVPVQQVPVPVPVPAPVVAPT